MKNEREQQEISKRVFIVIPTFRETEHVRRLLNDLLAQEHANFQVRIVNCNPGDGTSDLISRFADSRFKELRGNSDMFWTAAIEFGQQVVADEAGIDDFLLLLNCDIRIPADHLLQQLRAAVRFPRSLICPVTVSDGVYISSGCRMDSWVFGIASHFRIGSVEEQSRMLDDFVSVDMLAGRALFGPLSVLKEVGFVATEYFPHYAADYEYSARAKRRGYQLYIATSYEVNNDATNSGIKSNARGSNLFSRIRGLGSIRSPLNLFYRIRFVWKVYPWYAIPSGMVINVMKIVIETIFGSYLWKAIKQFKK